MPADRINLHTILHRDDRGRLAKMASRIEEGAVFIYPTETIYGIGGRYDDSSVFQRILSIKQRKTGNSLILLGANRAVFSPLHLSFPPTAKRLAEAFWPGLLTMVLPSNEKPEGIAVRVTDHPFITALARFYHLPIFSTSANLSGEPYLPDPDAIYHLFSDRVDFMVDGGILPPSLPSTVVRFFGDNGVTIVREGCISAAEIFSIVNQ